MEGGEREGIEVFRTSGVCLEEPSWASEHDHAAIIVQPSNPRLSHPNPPGVQRENEMSQEIICLCNKMHRPSGRRHTNDSRGSDAARAREGDLIPWWDFCRRCPAGQAVPTPSRCGCVWRALLRPRTPGLSKGQRERRGRDCPITRRRRDLRGRRTEPNEPLVCLSSFMFLMQFRASWTNEVESSDEVNVMDGMGWNE